MQSTTITATIPLIDANGVIDNLVEAEFPEADISVITENIADARRLIDDGGPLKGESNKTLAEALKRLNVAQASNVAMRVKADIALIAVSVDPNAKEAASEILKTAGATITEPA